MCRHSTWLQNTVIGHKLLDTKSRIVWSQTAQNRDFIPVKTQIASQKTIKMSSLCQDTIWLIAIFVTHVFVRSQCSLQQGTIGDTLGIQLALFSVSSWPKCLLWWNKTRDLWSNVTRCARDARITNHLFCVHHSRNLGHKDTEIRTRWIPYSDPPRR